MSAKAKKAYENLLRGVEDLINSGRWAEYLRFQAKFYNYSCNNTILILMQCPHASRVAGFNTWKQLGRYVKKGEKAIKILAPLTYKKMVEDEKGNREEKTVVRGFRVVNVFDISQTEGEELPEICTPLAGDSEDAAILFAALKEVIEIDISEEEIPGSAHGYYDLGNDRIALEIKNALNHKAKTLVHEYVHAMLDGKSSNLQQSRKEAEIVAESVAYIVSHYFGLDTSSYSFGYVAAWSGADPKEILKKGELIQRTAGKIIEQVEEMVKKLKQAA